MNALRQFRSIAIAEGISFIALVFIAMPLKYQFGLPIFVRVIGSLHGFLFVLFIVASLRAALERKWSLVRWLLAFVSSLVPFGTFVFDRSLKRELSTAASAPPA